MTPRTSTALALILALSTGTAHAAAQWSFSDIDADGNLELSSREFTAVSRDAFSQLDRNQDQMLDEQELAAGDRFYEGSLDLSQWDANADARVDWDEFHERLFASYDANNDAALAEAEFADLGMTPSTTATTVATEPERNRIELGDWSYDDLYSRGFSAEAFIDDTEVYGVGGEEIGNVEDLLIGPDGKVVSVIAEVGGFWDIGDRHVSIPWESVSANATGDGITVPVTEETVDDYDVYNRELITRQMAAGNIVGNVDDALAGNRLWRASEVIGDYSRLAEGGNAFREYGYVSDLIIVDGQVKAVVIQPDSGYGAVGSYAYPYYGYDYGYGWQPGNAYYDMPYNEGEIAELEAFDSDRLGTFGGS